MPGFRVMFVSERGVFPEMDKLWLALLLLYDTSVCKHSLTDVTMPVSLPRTFFFITIRNINGFPPQVLPIHLSYGCVWGLEIVKRNEAVLFWFTWLGISHDFGRENYTKLAKNVFQLFFINAGGDIANENVGTNFLGTLVLARLVDFDSPSEQFNHMKKFNWVVSVMFALKLDEAVVLMFVCHLVPWYMNVHYWSRLNKQFPYQLFIHSTINVAYVYSCFLVPLEQRSSKTLKCLQTRVSAWLLFWICCHFKL